jgi:hypothetical protein
MTVYSFVPSTKSPPQFQPTLDGQQYLVQVIWGLFGQRYYVKCSTIQGVLIFFLPLIESPGGQAIESLVWDEPSGLVKGATSIPHGFRLGATVALTVSGAAPVVYNGQQLVFITGPSSFEFPLAPGADPGAATIAGSLSFNISLTAGYFNSTMVYRNDAFEVNP